jgi:hypothetical protein
MYKLKCFSNASIDSILEELAHLPPDDNEALCMSVKFLNKRSQADRIRILAAIPATVKYLDLSVNFLAALTGEEFGGMLAAIPSTVEILELSGNYLFEYDTCEELVTAFKRLPSGIKVLGLSYNNLSCKTLEDLEKIWQSLPRHVTTLDLRGSNLVDESVDTLKKILAAVPSHIKFIDLGENRLQFVKLSESESEGKSDEEIKEIMSVVPVGTSVNIGWHDHPIILKGTKSSLPSLLDARAGKTKLGDSRPSTAVFFPDISSAASRRVTLRKDDSVAASRPPLHSPAVADSKRTGGTISLRPDTAIPEVKLRISTEHRMVEIDVSGGITVTKRGP